MLNLSTKSTTHLATLLPILLMIPILFSPVFASNSFSARDSAQRASREYTDDDAFKEAVLNVTNTYRKQHNATSLKWNNSLAEFAQDWGEACVFEHSGGPNGENLASGYPNASASIIAWGHERVDYDFIKAEFTHETGHFTQLVWKSSKTVGCSRTACNGQNGDGKAPGWYVICEYFPPGNVIGQFKDNVQEQVPQDQQPEGPSDPQVPSGQEDCPQGAVCGGAGRIRGSMKMMWVVVLGIGVGSWGGL